MDNNTLRDDLDAFIEYDGDLDDFDVDRSVPLERHDEANRLLRRRERHLRDKHQLATLAAQEIERIQAWQRDRTAGIDRDLEWIDSTLEAFMRMVAKRDNVTSVALPNGRLQLRKGADSIVIEDTAAFIAWAEANGAGALVKITKDVTKTDIKNWFGDRIDTASPTTIEDEGVRLFPFVDGNGQHVPGVKVRRLINKGFSIPKAPASATNDTPKENDQ